MISARFSTVRGTLPALLALLALLALASAGCPARRPGAGGGAGWEGFFPAGRIDAAWLARRQIPLPVEVVARVWPRVAKLALAQGVQTSGEAEIGRVYRRYCASDAVRAWNDRRCAALDARSSRTPLSPR